jgi:hypothetical protein
VAESEWAAIGTHTKQGMASPGNLSQYENTTTQTDEARYTRDSSEKLHTIVMRLCPPTRGLKIQLGPIKKGCINAKNTKSAATIHFPFVIMAKITASITTKS